MHLLLSFQSGIVRPMLATTRRPGAMGKIADEAIQRCRDLAQPATIVVKDTLDVIGEVHQDDSGWVCTLKEPLV